MFRVGLGYDAHRFRDGRKCILCGVEVPSGFGPDGHSDADVPVHALIDALLGALSLGDIGKYFPDSDEMFRDANSILLLQEVHKSVKSRGYALGNADITLVMELPRISQYTTEMRKNIADAMDTDIDRISVKATTEEKMGFTGDGTGIKAIAIVLLTSG